MRGVSSSRTHHPGAAGCIVELKCNMELEDVKKKRKTGELPLSKFGGKSEVWSHFKQVVGSDNICVGFVECIKCGRCSPMTANKMGTWMMNRHMKQARQGRKDDSQPSTSSFVSSPSIGSP